MLWMVEEVLCAGPDLTEQFVVHKVGETIPRVFQAFFQSHKLTFPYVIATKSNRNNDLHQGSFLINTSKQVTTTL